MQKMLAFFMKPIKKNISQKIVHSMFSGTKKMVLSKLLYNFPKAQLCHKNNQKRTVKLFRNNKISKIE